MASIPLAAITAAPQAADPPFRALDASQPSWATSGGTSNDTFRSLLRSDSGQRTESSEPRSGERDSNLEQRPDDTAAAAHAAPTNAARANEDRPRGDDAEGERGQAGEQTRAEESDNTSDREQPADSAQASEASGAEESAEPQAEQPATDERAHTEASDKPNKLVQEAAEKPLPGHKTEAAKPDVSQAGPAADKLNGRPSAEAAGASNASAAAKAAAEPAVVADAPAEHVEAAGPIAKGAASEGGEQPTTSQPGAGTTDAAAGSEGEGVKVSNLQSTVIGPSAPLVEGEGESSPTTLGTTGAQATTKTSPGAGEQRSVPGRADAPATEAANVPAAASEASGAASGTAVQAAPTAATPTATAGAESTASAAPQEASPAVTTDPTATGETAEPTGNQNTERTDSTARTHAARGEGVKDGSLTVADRVRLVQRAAIALESAHVRGGELRMRLEPPELGSIRVELSSDNGSISARIEAESTQVQRLLMESLPQLRERLAEQQIKIEHFQVDVMNQHDRQFAHMRHDQQDRRGGDARPAHASGHEATQGERRELHRDPATLRQQLPWELDRLNVLV